LIEECSPAEQARLCNGYAIALLHARQLDNSMNLARRAGTHADVSGLVWEKAYASILQTWLANIEGREEDSRVSAAEASHTCRQLQQPWLDGFNQLASAFTHVYALRHEQALKAMCEAVDTFDRARDRHMSMFAIVQVGLQQILTGDLPGAGRNILRGLDLARQIANSRAFTGVCETTAYIAVRKDHADLAARLMGAAEAGRIMSGAPQFPYWIKPHDQAWSETCSRLGEVAARNLFAAGRLAGPRECAALAAAFLRSETASR